MSTFETLVIRIDAIEEIKKADKIEVAVVGGYRSVVPKRQFKAGDLAVYMREDSIVPAYLSERLGYAGKLVGPNKDRIKAVMLRACLSQGILIKLEERDGVLGISNQTEFRPVVENEDVSEFLGVTKYVPEIPKELDVVHIGVLPKFDVENSKKHPYAIEPGEMVEFTEKAHGTCTGFLRLPTSDYDGIIPLADGGMAAAFSKGIGNDGLVFKHFKRVPRNWLMRQLAKLSFLKLLPYRDVSVNEKNVYVRQLRRNQEALERLYEALGKPEVLAVYGETYGTQDLKYGLEGDTGFMVFDIYVVKNGQGRFLNFMERKELAEDAGFAVVPQLYVGPFSKEVMYEHTSGVTIIGGGVHIREGIVVRVLNERYQFGLSRVILKSINPAYLTRSNPDATEYQ
jgi:RNA ligase (TIGR02306 family)